MIRLFAILTVLFYHTALLYAATDNQSLINRLATIDGVVQVQLLTPLTQQTQRLSVQLLTPLLAEDASRQILLPVGTRLLGRQQSYYPQNGHALVTCTQAVTPDHQVVPITAYLSSDARTVGVLVSKTHQPQYMVPQHTQLTAVFNSKMLLNGTPADDAF